MYTCKTSISVEYSCIWIKLIHIGYYSVMDRFQLNIIGLYYMIDISITTGNY